MKAIIITGKGQVTVSEVPQPEKPDQGHIIIKMNTMGINAGDKLLISGNFSPGLFNQSQYDIAGVSGVGRVIAIGEGVPQKYLDKNVTVYRSLTASNDIVGTWSEYVQLPYLQCAILPDEVNPDDYAGSLVNIITAYGAWKQTVKEGHKGIVITAGNSDTGKAMLGICLKTDFPVISIVRNAEGKKELEELGAKHILIQGTQDFQKEFAALTIQLGATAIFDGVGGALLNEIIGVLPAGTTIYAYGFLGGGAPLSFHTSLLMNGITIKGFSNFKTETVQDPEQLAEGLTEISEMIRMPHFRFKAAKKFSFEQINEALLFTPTNEGKAVLQISG